MGGIFQSEAKGRESWAGGAREGVAGKIQIQRQNEEDVAAADDDTCQKFSSLSLCTVLPSVFCLLHKNVKEENCERKPQHRQPTIHIVAVAGWAFWGGKVLEATAPSRAMCLLRRTYITTVGNLVCLLLLLAFAFCVLHVAFSILYPLRMYTER